MEHGTTERGFSRVDFVDSNGEKCSLQKSSIATEHRVWLGIDSPKPMLMVRDKGWTDVHLPEGTLLTGRMHLTQWAAIDLASYLRRFGESGDLHLDRMAGPESRKDWQPTRGWPRDVLKAAVAAASKVITRGGKAELTLTQIEDLIAEGIVKHKVDDLDEMRPGNGTVRED